MRYVAAYLLASLGGAEPDLKAIEKILSSVGIETDKAKAEKVIASLKGKKVADLITEGTKKLATVSAAAPAAAPAAAAAAPAAAAAAKPAENGQQQK
jgi:ribosomal protein L12E/L44/L45/RPP1/RPP2